MPKLTTEERETVRRLCETYNKATATGTGRQAERAEKALNNYLDSITR